MGKIGTGLFFYTIGKAMVQRSILVDGTVCLPYGKDRAVVATDETYDPFTTEVFTRAEIVRALTAAQRGFKSLDVVRSQGLSLVSEAGKGRATIAALLIRRMGAEAAQPVIDAMVERHLEAQIEDLAA
jgi:hypothetical protein